MLRPILSIVVALALCGAAQAQTALAPWFDADGFYNKPGVELARASADMAACRTEAARLRVVRNTNTRVGTAFAFNADGSYNPAVSGAATGIASILFAIQDARYNGSIEQIEFRDCALAFGYRHYRLSESGRTRFNSEADHGFVTLISSATPAAGRLNEGEVERNYFGAELVELAYDNPAPPAAGDQSEAATPALMAALSPEIPTGVISRIAAGELATPRPGMAIVVASARQQSGSLQIPVAGDTFAFRRVTADGKFIDLLQPSVSFSLRSHFNPERRRDASLAGDFDAPRYSTYQIPVGRYVLSDVGAVNACLGTITFEVADGDVAYLGDFVLRAPGLPMGTLFNPVGNINSGMDNRLRADLRVDVSEDFETARHALQAGDDVRSSLARVHYENGYRVPCDGRYIGRVAGPGWSDFDPVQLPAFNDAVASAAASAQ